MLKTCDKCQLAIENNFTPVKPRGNIHGGLFFIGEAPGYKEKKLGYTFVGKAGTFLQQYVNKYNLNSISYFTNAIKCRPPRNRTPYMDEILICRQHLLKEIAEGKPKVIVLLGNSAVNSFFKAEINGITKLNNRLIKCGDSYILFGFHPSYIMREKDREYLYDNMFSIIYSLSRIKINKYL